MKLYEDRIAELIDACDKAGITDPVAFLLSKRVVIYDWLKGCFPFGILPTDIDGLVHLHHHFLMMEFKYEWVLRHGKIPKGQHRCLKALSATKRFTVFIIGVNAENEPSCLTIYREDGTISPLLEANRERIKRACEKWAAHIQRTFDLEGNRLATETSTATV